MGKLATKDLEIMYPATNSPALIDVNIEIAPGSITVLQGRSGSGKSTLLRAFAGLQAASKGEATLDGECVFSLSQKQRAQSLALLAQDYQLFPHMTVMKNCTHPLQNVLGLSHAEAEKCATQLLQQLEVGHLSERYPHQLSGGQQQRVGLARALGMGSKVLLLDEPNSALDAQSTEALVKLLLNLNAQGMTVVISTHDMAFAEMLSANTITIQNGQIQEVNIKPNTHTKSMEKVS